MNSAFDPLFSEYELLALPWVYDCVVTREFGPSRSQIPLVQLRTAAAPLRLLFSWAAYHQQLPFEFGDGEAAVEGLASGDGDLAVLDGGRLSDSLRIIEVARELIDRVRWEGPVLEALGWPPAAPLALRNAKQARRYLIPRERGPALRFQGELAHYVSSRAGSGPSSAVLSVFNARHATICVREERQAQDPHTRRVTAHPCQHDDEVREFFGNDRLALRLYKAMGIDSSIDIR